MNFFEQKIKKLRHKIQQLEIQLEEMNECGDLEDRMEAAFEIEDAKDYLLRFQAKFEQLGMKGEN